MNEKTKTRIKVTALVLGFFTVDGLLMFGYRYFDVLARADQVPMLEPLIEEMTGAYAGAILGVALYWFSKLLRFSKSTWKARLPIYLLAMIVYSAAHTSMNAIGRQLLFPMADLGAYDYGMMALRFPMEFFNDIANFWFWVLLFHLFFHYRESRDRELRAARLEAELTQAKLGNLRAQLQPHFLFNTLNTISSHMYNDPSRADRLISRLSDLLRVTLASSARQEVTLREELEVLRLYCDLMKGRFEDQLEFSLNIDPECEAAMVPSMILQPLVENAIRHGTSVQSDVGKIAVTCERENGALSMSVRDNGPGIEGDAASVMDAGVGIKNTVERLRSLYGDSQSLQIENQAGGGLSVTVTVPLQTDSENQSDGLTQDVRENSG